MRTFGFIAAGIFVLAWLFFPNLFQWWAIHVWSIPADQLDEMGKLGPLGDIYGSLNTLFTSVTLIIVVYSAYLQRQANKDAREAMDKQLKQARSDTAKQLRESRRALQLQLKQTRELADLQLKQAKKSSEEQLFLAKLAHEEQIKESKSAIFSNLFYSLLNLKFNKFTELTIHYPDEVWKADKIFINLSDEFQRLLAEEWQEVETLNEKIIRGKFEEFLNIDGDHASDMVYSYFTLTTSLIRLIIRSDLEQFDKQFFFEILANSMTLHEQITLFWIAPSIDDFYYFLKDTGIFSQFYTDEFVLYGMKFYDKTYFSESSWYDHFDKHTNQNSA